MDNKIGIYLINEDSPLNYDTKIIKNSGKYLVIEAILQDFEVNRNKRLYPRDVLIAGLNSDYIKERLATKSWFGEYGHPLNADVSRQLHYDMNNVSHIVKSFTIDNRFVKGIVEGADTDPMGHNFTNLVRQGVKVAFSMRGLSDVIEKRGDITVVKGPLVIFCYDCVVQPSHSSAYMTKVLTEDLKNLSSDINGILSESGMDYLTKVKKEASEYVKNNSRRIKNISEQFEFNPKVEVINESQVKLSGKHNMIINVEDYVANNYKSYLKKLPF